MTILIVDLDWLGKISFLPNPDCMKMSSYYKQLGHSVSLAEKNLDINMSYDRVMVFRQSMRAKMPKEIDLKSKKVEMYGRELSYYNRYKGEISDAIAMCRPDYLLYTLPETNKVTKADIVQFFSNGVYLDVKQDYNNAHTGKKVLMVADKDFWSHDYKDLLKCCKEMGRREVGFLHSVPLQSLVQHENKMELFLGLKFQTNSYIRLEYGMMINSPKTIENLIVFIEKIGSRHISFPTLHLPSILGNHSEDELSVRTDIVRCLKIIEVAKKQKVRVVLETPNTVDSIYHGLFLELERWTKCAPRMSLSDYLIGRLERITGINRGTIMQMPTFRSMPTVWMMRLLGKDLMRKYGLRQWGNQFSTDEGIEEI